MRGERKCYVVVLWNYDFYSSLFSLGCSWNRSRRYNGGIRNPAHRSNPEEVCGSCKSVGSDMLHHGWILFSIQMPEIRLERRRSVGY